LIGRLSEKVWLSQGAPLHTYRLGRWDIVLRDESVFARKTKRVNWKTLYHNSPFSLRVSHLRQAHVFCSSLEFQPQIVASVYECMGEMTSIQTQLDDARQSFGFQV